MDKDGDLKVKVRDHSWLYGPAVCSPVANTSLTDAEMHVYAQLTAQAKLEVKKDDTLMSLGDSDGMTFNCVCVVDVIFTLTNILVK